MSEASGIHMGSTEDDLLGYWKKVLQLLFFKISSFKIFYFYLFSKVYDTELQYMTQR